MTAAAMACGHCGATPAPSSRFCNHCGARLVADHDERRALAVLFCDIVGSTHYLQALGPEDWLSILRDFHETTSRVVHRFGGYVAQHLGDGQLVYFGFPEAHDDDARRAVETALDIMAGMSELNARLLYRGWPELRVRIGISTGRALVGSVGHGSEALAHGEIPHLAARLQAMAEPNTVLIDQATFRLVDAFFQCQPVEGRTPRDFPQVSLYAVVGRTRARGRLDVGGAHHTTAFVGRSSELAALADAWSAVEASGQRNVLVRAEAGMGKTRLVQTFRAQLQGAEHVFECRASAYHGNRALYPVAEMLERSLGITADEPKERRLGKLERWLAGSSALGLHMLSAFAPLFAIDVPPDRAIVDVSPQRQRQLLFQSLARWFEFLSKRGTVLLVFEDLHWADPSTLELLDGLIAGESTRHLLLVMTARPEFAKRWPGRCIELSLERLPDGDIRQIVGALAPDDSLAGELSDLVLRKADGVPFFAEELTKTLLESGAFGVATPSRRLGSAPPTEVPSALGGVLTARLDRLGRARHTAQLAAALGREFRFDILSAVSATPRDDLAEDVEQLVSAGILHAISKDTYAFRHALMRDAAYELSLTHARQNVHARIASALEERFPEVVASQPDLLAFHHAAANQNGVAVAYAQRAAEHALQRSAYAEAMAHASNAIAWSEALDGTARAEAELAANGVLSQSVMATRGWADPQVEAIAGRSGALLRQVDVFSRHRIPTLWSLFSYHHTASQRRAAHDVAEQLVAIADASGDAGLRAAAATILGITLHVEGNFVDAQPALERAIALYDPKLHRDQGAQMGLDSLVLAKALLAHLRWAHGDDAGAFALVAEAIQWARDVRHVPSIAIGLLYGCQIYQLAGDKAVVTAMTEEILSLADKHGLPAYEGYAAIMHAWATRDEARAEAILGMLAALGCKLGLSYWASLVADNLAERGALDDAIARIDQCIALCPANDEHYYEPELHRRRAAYALARDGGRPGPQVRASLERAADVAAQRRMPRTEALAIGDLLAHFGDDPGRRTRLEALGLRHPELRATTTNHD